MNVESLAEMLPAHRGAFEVPARPPAAPGTVPAGLFGARRLPQDEVAVGALVRRHFDASTGHHFIEGAMRELAVIRHGAHGEKNMTLGRIGMAGGDQTLHDGDHLRDMVRGARLDGGAEAAQRIDVLLEATGRAFGQFADRYATLGGPRDDLIVDVGDVAGVDDVVGAIEMAQKAKQHVEDDDGPGIADMGSIVDGRSADVEAHALGLERREVFFATRHRVVEAQSHPGPSIPTPRERAQIEGDESRAVARPPVRRSDTASRTAERDAKASRCGPASFGSVRRKAGRPWKCGRSSDAAAGHLGGDGDGSRDRDEANRAPQGLGAH